MTDLTLEDILSIKRLKLCADDDLDLAVRELLDPCNLLVPMSNDGKIGFGQLRYQEHLAAKEIMTNRSIIVTPLLRQTWWSGVLVLLAQMNSDLTWLIDEVGRQRNIRTYTDIVQKMIRAAPLRSIESLLHSFQLMAQADGYAYNSDRSSDR